MSFSRDTAYIQYLLQQARRLGQPGDFAGTGLYNTKATCVAPDCGRTFRGLAALQEHAEAVHTFDDIRRLVSEAVREKYNKEGDYRASPPVPGVWTYVEDLATDWVVFEISEGTESSLMKAAYSIVDDVVQLGEPVEVHRRTVYEPVKAE